jgi:hypothetical protein
LALHIFRMVFMFCASRSFNVNMSIAEHIIHQTDLAASFPGSLSTLLFPLAELQQPKRNTAAPPRVGSAAVKPDSELSVFPALSPKACPRTLCLTFWI